MPIDRTNYNALVNDSGSGTDGSIVNKLMIKDVLLDPIDAAIGAGGLIAQVIVATYSTETTNSSLTYADTGLTGSITPADTNNKILVLAIIGSVGKISNDTGVNLKLLRGATDLSVFCSDVARNGSATINMIGSCATLYLDSPASAAAQTYKVQFASSQNLATAVVQGNNVKSSMLLLEIVVP